jgi:hypothetical protein
LPEESARMANVDYRAALGNWIASTTRSDVAHATQYLGRFQTNPSPEHWDAVVRVFAYLKATASLALVFGGRPTAPLLSLWTDASWSSDPADSVSTRGHVVYHRGNLIAAKSKRITTAPSRSCSTGSSSPGRGLATGKVAALRPRGARSTIRSPVPLLCDNQSAIATVEAEHHSSRTRHIALAHNTIFHLADVGLLEPAHVPSKDMPADMLTKP